MTLTGEIPPNVTGYHSVDLLWTLADSRRAQREGWNICEGSNGLEIGNLAFRSDDEAIRHCFRFSDRSTLHARALAIHFHSLATRGGK